MKHYRIVDILAANGDDIAPIVVQGWVKTKRTSKNVSFINLNDGSTIRNLQIVVNTDLATVLSEVNTGCSISVTGRLEKSLGGEQATEMIAEKITILGRADESYPLQPKTHSIEFLRSIAHLRLRTSTLSAVMRIRSALTYAIHRFFQSRNFINIHSPIITTIDAEGAGEMFSITTLDYEAMLRSGARVLDYANDFFGTKASLTVTGQLEAEAAIFGLGAVYTFGPTFRAENSNTTRHLAEFWMVEPEVAFYDLNDNMRLATEMLKEVISYVLQNCDDDLDFLEKRKLKEQSDSALSLPLREQLHSIANDNFEILSYTDAIEILQNSEENRSNKFKYKVSGWGMDLQTEHERFLVEKYFKKPVTIINYPKDIKAFYMRQNDDGKTVAAMDVLFPGIGEIVGGSQREERPDRLLEAMTRFKIDQGQMQWYVDTRKFGSVVHSGFGLGLERLVMFITGMENIRDVIPFPRTPGNARNSSEKS